MQLLALGTVELMEEKKVENLAVVKVGLSVA